MRVKFGCLIETGRVGKWSLKPLLWKCLFFVSQGFLLEILSCIFKYCNKELFHSFFLMGDFGFSGGRKPWSLSLWLTRSLTWSSWFSSDSTCWPWQWTTTNRRSSSPVSSTFSTASSSSSSAASASLRSLPYDTTTSRSPGTSLIS